VPFEEALWAAKEGDLVGPVETDEGWEVALVVARKTVEDDNTERSEAYVRNKLEKRELDSVRARFLDGLHQRYEAEVNDELLDPSVLAPLVEQPEAAAADTRILVTYQDGSLTLAEFVGSIRPRSFLALRPGEQRRQATQLLDNQLDQAMLKLEAERRWKNAPEESKADVAWLENDMVFRSLLDRVVFKDLTVSDEEIAAHREANREQYMEPTKVRFGIALLGTEDDAATFLRDVKEGVDFGELARERSLDADTAARDGDAGWISAKQAIAPLRGAPFEAPAGTSGGPIRLDQGWLVYKVFDRREPTPLADEEARARIRSDLLRAASDERMSRWETQLRAVAEIEVLDDGLRKAGEILREERADRRLEAKPAMHPMPRGGVR
jgi:parvulin-like peptidyl-prolyl isomerase